MALRTVGEIRSLVVEKPLTIQMNSTLYDVIILLTHNPITRHVYVVDEQIKLLGSIRLNDLVEAIFPFLMLGIADEKEKKDALLTKLFNLPLENFYNKSMDFVKEDTTLADLIPLMIDGQLNELPVIDDNMVVIGEVNLLEILKSISSP